MWPRTEGQLAAFRAKDKGESRSIEANQQMRCSSIKRLCFKADDVDRILREKPLQLQQQAAWYLCHYMN